MAGIEDHAVAELERPAQVQEDFLSLQAADFAKEHAALFPKAGMDQFLIVRAAQPTGVKSTREGHFHLVTRRIRNCVRCRRRFRKGTSLPGRSAL